MKAISLKRYNIMLLIENLSEKQLQDVRIACSYLFSPELARDDEFVINLDFASINKALKEKKKRYDPAHHPDESEEMILKRKERFINIKLSYEILMPYIFEEEKIIPEQNSRKSRIIAVGGANHVPIVENKPFARTPFKITEIGDYIIAELYQAVAEVLAYVYRLKGMRTGV